MVLFEIHHRFKGHFFNELGVSFKTCLIHNDVTHFDSLILSNIFLCNFLVFWLAILAFMFSASYLVLELFFVFSTQVFQFFVENLCSGFYLVNSDCGAYLAFDQFSLWYLS